MLYSQDLTLKDDLDITASPYYGFDSNQQTLFIKNLPKNCPRKELEDAFKEMPGFTTISLSEPLKTQEFVRFGWIIFKKDA